MEGSVKMGSGEGRGEKRRGRRGEEEKRGRRDVEMKGGRYSPLPSLFICCFPSALLFSSLSPSPHMPSSLLLLSAPPSLHSLAFR
jgi:hypothetical protein